MNAPARIDHPQRSTGPAWERYLPVVDALCPGTSPEEARNRAGIMLLRDLATERLRSASGPAALVLQAIVQIAFQTGSAPMSVEDLDITRMALIRLGIGARELEKVFGDRGDG